MAIDITTISVEMDTSSLRAGQAQLNRTAAAGANLARSFAGVAAAFGAGLGVTELARKLVDTERVTGSLMASLEVATGSAKNAESAFSSLAQLSSELPESLNDVTKAFTMMVNLGLDPSQAAMKSYSNTASAMNKSLMQMVEAVADATTGQYERLKEFGIKASAQGDKVAFTFRGTTTTVKNSADEITKYLKSIGENEFAGMAEKKMATLDGAISNLSDSWDGLFRTINKQGSGAAMTELVRSMTKSIQDFDAAIASSQVEGYIEAIKIQFRGLAGDIETSTKIIGDLFGSIGKSVGITKDDVTQAFTEMPQNIRAFIQIVVVELLSLSEKAVAVGNLMREALNPMKVYNGEALGNFRKDMERINGVRDDSISSILKEKDATTQAANEQRKYADFARVMYDWNSENAKQNTENLGKYKVQAEKVTELTKEQQKALESAAKLEESRAQNIADMVVSITRETDLMNEQSKEAQIRYDIEKGILDVKGGINGAEAQSLIKAAQANDIKREQLKIEEELNKKIQSDVEQQTKWALDAVEEWGDAAQKQSDEISQSLTDALMRGFESGKGFADNLKDTVKNMFKSLVLKPVIQPLMEKASGAISGAIGTFGSKGSAGTGALGSMGPYGAIAAVAATAIGSIVSTMNEKQEKELAKLTSEFRQGTQSTGTLLGNANLKSDSINKALTEMGDNGVSLLDVNHGMYQALLDIKTGIAGSAAGFARQGLGANAASGIATGTTTFGANEGIKSLGMNATKYAFGGNLLPSKITDIVYGFMGTLTDKISSALYNKKTSIIDSGIEILGGSLAGALEAGMIGAMNYAEVKSTTKVLGIKTGSSVKTETSDLNDEFKIQFAKVFEGAGTALEEASKSFGVTFDASKLMIDATKLSLKGLQGEALTKEIESFFSSTLDKWAGSLVDGLVKFQEVGEGAFETMVRLASQTNIFTNYAEELLPKFNLVGMAAIEATQAVADLSGGFDRLNTNMSSYYNNFFDETEKSARGLSQISEALAGVGLAMPKTRDEFRALVESLDITSESQQKQYAALLDVNQAFAQFVPAAKEAKDATTELVDSFDKIAEQQKSLSEKLFDITATDAQKRQAELDAALSVENRAIQQQIFAALDLADATKKASDALAEQESKARSVAQERYNLESQILQLNGDTNALKSRELALLDESNQPLQKMIWSLEDLAKESEKAAADVQASAQKIAEATKAANDERAGLEREYFNLTATEQEKRQAKLTSLLSDEARLTQNKIYSFNDAKEAAELASRLAQEEASARQKAQEDADNAMRQSQQQQIDDAKRAAEEQRKLAQGVHDSITSALKSLMGESETLNAMTQSQARLTLQNALMTAKSGGSIVGFAGLDDALGAIQKQGTYSSSLESRLAMGRNIGLLSELSKYTKVDGSHANGLESVPYDGYIAQLHKGERVQTAKEAQSSSDLAAKVDRLIEVVNAGNIAIAQNTAKGAKVLEKWDNDGIAETRSVA